MRLLMEGKYISLITFTKDGKPITTPVWFGQKENNLYIATNEKRYKIKRIQNNPSVQVAICGFRGKVKGSYKDATARILPENETDVAKETLREKYFMFRVFERFWKKKEKKGKSKELYVEITLKN